METGVPTPVDGLPPREQQVLRLLARAKSSKEIANLLDLGLVTVPTYRKTLMKKVGVTNIAGLTRVAMGAGLACIEGDILEKTRLQTAS